MRHLRSSTRTRVPGIAPGTLAGLGAHGLVNNSIYQGQNSLQPWQQPFHALFNCRNASNPSDTNTNNAAQFLWEAPRDWHYARSDGTLGLTRQTLDLINSGNNLTALAVLALFVRNLSSATVSRSLSVQCHHNGNNMSNGGLVVMSPDGVRGSVNSVSRSNVWSPAWSYSNVYTVSGSGTVSIPSGRSVAIVLWGMDGPQQRMDAGSQQTGYQGQLYLALTNLNSFLSANDLVIDHEMTNAAMTRHLTWDRDVWNY